MNAGPQRIVDLLTTASNRMVIPVYQRAYSWDEEQCQQLWDDIVATGRRGEGTHFTGSVVMVLDGTPDFSGMSRVLVIDGQQRITTLTLLLVALAEFARDNPDKVSHFSFEEVMGNGYLVSPYKKGPDHYRLTLSQGDETTLRSVIDHLENPDVDVVPEAHRIIENLDFFRSSLQKIDGANVVWDGIRRLEVVTISLAQGQDNPQLIFESMNSTGKDLSTADLVRNYVLMGLPMAEQEDLYANYWRKIEETLGADSYDRVFDDFLRNWLTVISAPTTVVTRDVYRLFKRYAAENDYDKPGHMAKLLKDLRRFAGYYACITAGACEDAEIRVVLGRIAALDVSVVNPLLMSFCEDYAAGEGPFTRDDLLSMLRTTESYLFRRSVCDVATNSLNKFFSSVIARLNAVQEEGGNYREAYEAILLGEEGTARRMPGDDEFERALKTRDCYAFRRGFYLLATLENSHHPKNPLDLYNGGYTIEHIMPRNALNRQDWREMLGADYERVYDECVNTLGNLTLTAYNSELSDASFAQKKARAIGGYDKDYLVISAALHDADTWDEGAIKRRGAGLARRALAVWPMPQLAKEVIESYRPAKKSAAPGRAVTFRMVCASGRIKPGDKLVATLAGETVTAEVTGSYTIRLSSGEEVESPSRAAIRTNELATGKHHSMNGWAFWHLGEGGPLLSDVRVRYLMDAEKTEAVDLKSLRAAFWDGLFSYCSDRPDFTKAYGDQSERWENSDWYVTFGLGLRDAHATAFYARRDGWVGASVYVTDFSLYDRLQARRDEAEALLGADGGEVVWNDANEKSRELLVKLPCDVSPERWDELYPWIADRLLAIRRIAGWLR
ncbi:DUF4268 domain-containing protein [Thermophilibacter sp.]